MSKSYPFTLTKDQLDELYDDYSMVEYVIEEIVKQAKAQGYIPPDERKQHE